MEYFIICTDESCLMATPGGPIKIIGDKGKKKHEKIAGDSRVSLFACGDLCTVEGEQGQRQEKD